MKTYKFLILGLIILVSCSEKKTIKLGATFPLTGEVASYGIHAKNGIQLKVDEINSNGGIKGEKVEIDFQDDKNDVKEAVNIMNGFATINKYPVVFGSAGSTVSLALAPIANKNHIVLISPISSSSELSDKGGEYFFRTCPADNVQAIVLANWVYESGVRKVAVIYTNNSWGQPLSNDFERIFTNLGGEVVFNEGTLENIKDFRTIISKIKKLDIDAIVSPTYPKEGGLFVKQLKELGVNVKLFGGDNWGAPEFLEIAKDAANGVFFTAPSESKSPKYDDFEKKYQEKFNEKPDIFSAYAYDAATAIFKAVENVDNIDAELIKQELHKISFTGVSGEVSFKENGDIQNEGYGKKTIENQEFKFINE